MNYSSSKPDHSKISKPSQWFRCAKQWLAEKFDRLIDYLVNNGARLVIFFILLFIVLIIALITLKGLMQIYPSWNDSEFLRRLKNLNIKTIGEPFKVIAVSLAGLFAIKQIQLYLTQSRQSRALEYSIVRSEHLREIRNDLNDLAKHNNLNDHPEWGIIPPEKLIPKLDNPEREPNTDPDEKHKTLPKCLHDLFAHWENLAHTIECDITDRHVAFEMVGQTVVTYVTRYWYFVSWRRFREHNERLYRYLIPLAIQWAEELDSRGIKSRYIRFLGRTQTETAYRHTPLTKEQKAAVLLHRTREQIRAYDKHATGDALELTQELATFARRIPTSA